MVLQKYLDGVTTPLTTPDASVSQFLVLPDGGVILSGLTPSTGMTWVRYRSPSGKLVPLEPYTANFLALFPDGNVYMSSMTGQAPGVSRFLTATGALDSELWIGPAAQSYNDIDTWCQGLMTSQGFCGNDGGYVDSTVTTTGGDVFAIDGNMPPRAVAQYYPTVQPLTTEVQSPSVIQAAGDKLVIAGLDAQQNNVLTLYDPASTTETELLGASDQIEIYHLTYDAAQDEVLFDGLRFADDTYVVGQVDLTTDTVTVTTTTSSKLADLQSFN
jgi:hypothetical protein